MVTENRKSPKKKKALIRVAIILLVAALILFGVNILRDALWTDTDEEILIEIPEGAGIGQIAELLEKNEVIGNAFAFRIYEKFAEDRVYQSGLHTFYKGMSYNEVLLSLAEMTKNNGIVTVTIPEGYEMRQIARLLEEKGVCGKEAFMTAAKGDFPEFSYINEIKREENPLEGYLFPATYEFLLGQDAREVICRMLEAFDANIYAAYKESNTDKSLDEIIIMASVVEREAANDNERGKVASVFYNRLDIDMKLQSCATVQYIIKERKDVLSNSDIKIDSPYNTYMYKGLPIGPIASPGLNSVMAAINPEETDYLYFAATKDGSENIFSKTGEEHMQLVKELQR